MRSEIQLSSPEGWTGEVIKRRVEIPFTGRIPTTSRGRPERTVSHSSKLCHGEFRAMLPLTALRRSSPRVFAISRQYSTQLKEVAANDPTPAKAAATISKTNET